MRTLRIAFLSALVLELLATLSVALVAVEVGLRLVAGGIPYATALLVLILAPEAYLPLRQVGAEYHASAEGRRRGPGLRRARRTRCRPPAHPHRPASTVALRDVWLHRDGRHAAAIAGLPL